MTAPTPLPYGTPETPRVSVRGEARLEADPEIARLRITVTARGTDRTTTLHDLTQRNSRALDLLKSYGEAVEKTETGYISITPQLTEKGRGERISAYNGSIHLTATVNDFTVLGELTTRLADLPLTRIGGPWWALRPDSPAHAEVRRKAVREAVQRAREYAAALGADLTALLELADDGAEHTGFSGPGGAMPRRPRAAAGAAGAAASAPELDLEPQRQTLRAQVSARFTMTPPRL
ncbi:SIMPL domain-containing protein [Streptomyces roseifaciens]|uniref:SIMPL domain-containing protein n=1 Tax=Streptomyces roseifaciens TaxID=1488406 RepID=UPI000717E4A9|nr:SIMPL domain-containing protein [Streptomyces roseifaciens]